MKAHDVRHLTLCATCGGLGDRRKMLKIGLNRKLAVGHHHDACVIARLDDAEVLSLPAAERDKITIGSGAGVTLFHKLMDARG